MKKQVLMFLGICLLSCAYGQAGDTLSLTLDKAEELFLRKNLGLLSQRYQVDIARANEIQQKLYNNPTVSTELAAHGANQKWFDIGRRGEKMFGIDQLILLGKKRNKRVNMAREQTNETNLDFYDLLRNLKYELRENFYSLCYANEIIGKYDNQLRLLQEIIQSYSEQAGKRNVSMKDVVRLKTEYIQLSADRNSLVMEAISARQTLQLLIDTTAVINAIKPEWPENRKLPSPDSLMRLARKHRPDFQVAGSRLKQEELNLSLQKALAVPDVTIGAGYDQQGNYVSHLYTLRAAIDLPLFNRNQGNIKAAKAAITSAGYARDYKALVIDREIAAGHAKMKEAEREYELSQQSFDRDFPEVNEGVIRNFNKGNISILEFMDFFENYNAAMRQLNQLQKQRRLTWEALEYATGTSLDFATQPQP